MAVILKFVNSVGILTERFFAIKSVANPTEVTLKKVICDLLSKYNLQLHKIRGQGYDGASNMSGEYNGLKALFPQECPYAYFVHCFAHRLQLTLVALAKDCGPIWKFFSLLDKVINLVKSSPKRTTELLEAHKRDTKQMVERGELETRRGANQKIMMETMFLSQVFQRESVDILEAVGMVSTLKHLLHKLRDEGWEPLLEEVNSFCSKYDIDIPDLNMLGRRGMNKMPLEQLYHFEYFNQVIDYQMSELDSRFNETMVWLLRLGAALDPRDSFSSFNKDHIYELAVEFYPQDFADHEKLLLRSQLPYYERHVVCNSDFKVPSLAKLLEMLVKKKT
ncbi:Zinc finger MYM-type protein 1 [Linum grandiflorum]